MHKRTIFLLAILLALVGNIVFLLYAHPQLRDLFSPAYWKNLTTVGNVMRVVNTYYVHEDKVDYETLARASMEGMVQSLDRYSVYMREDDYKSFEEDTRQQYVGIGVQIERIDSRITVVASFEGGPAFEAGVQAGDKIVGVGEENTEDASLTQITELLRGKAGTPVRVKIYRPAMNEELAVDIVRRAVELASVHDIEVGSDGIAYMRINHFGEKTAGEFAAALDEIEGQGARALIIDLRNNPGGLLNSAVSVAGQYFNRGEVVVSTRGRTAAQSREFKAQPEKKRPPLPIVVLINSMSASASEIVAGALQDTGRAIIVGETSHGKGSVQSIYSLRNGDGLRQTTAMYYLPAGRTINEVGVVPDVPVPMTEEDYVRLVLQRRHTTYMDPEDFRRQFGFEPISDKQRDTANAILKSMISVKTYRNG